MKKNEKNIVHHSKQILSKQCISDEDIMKIVDKIIIAMKEQKNFVDSSLALNNQTFSTDTNLVSLGDNFRSNLVDKNRIIGSSIESYNTVPIYPKDKLLSDLSIREFEDLIARSLEGAKNNTFF